MTTRAIGVSGGRVVTVDSWGNPRGFPIFLLHGTPGSRSGPIPRPSVLYRLGVRLICYDRPGYGGSDRHEGRTVGDAAWDVLDIADEMGLDAFAVVGRSGGGPHALACAALFEKERLRTAAVLVGIAPSDANLDWYAGMADSNVEEYTRASQPSSAAVVANLTQRAEQVLADPESLLTDLKEEMTAPDRKVVEDVAFQRLLPLSYRQALSGGPYGWIDDVLAFRRPWGFELGKITVPVWLWHGQDDVFSPVHHSHWLADEIPNARIDVQQGAAHFTAMEVLPRILAQLKVDSADELGEVVPSVGLGVEGAEDPALLV